MSNAMESSSTSPRQIVVTIPCSLVADRIAKSYAIDRAISEAVDGVVRDQRQAIQDAVTHAFNVLFSDPDFMSIRLVDVVRKALENAVIEKVGAQVRARPMKEITGLFDRVVPPKAVPNGTEGGG